MKTRTLISKVAIGLAVGLTMMAAPDIAQAQDLTPVNNFATTIRDFMTGAFARIAGAIAIAFIGYRWFSGRMELRRALTIAAGIVLVLGAVSVVDFVDQGIN